MGGRAKLGDSARGCGQMESRPPICGQASHQTIRKQTIYSANMHRNGCLWHIQYADSDEEDVETHDLVLIVVENSTNPGTKCDTNKPAVVKPNT
jgi:hypothetical protein